MIVYRLAQHTYAEDITGTGAKITGGRWNSPGNAVLYTSEHISLALLEVLANAHTLSRLQALKLVEIDIPATATIREIKPQGLKAGWWSDFDYTQWIGDEMLRNAEHLVIKCPSAIVDRENNILLNPLHPAFKGVKLKTVTNFRFDERLFKAN